MIDVEWNDNAKAAVIEFADYIGQSDKCERYLKAFGTKKTVADAYEENPHWRKHVNGNIYFRITYGSHWMMTASEDVDSSLWALVCTREQFEAYVKEQEGEKWTHTLFCDKAYIKLGEPDRHGYVLVVTESDGYNLARPSELKPIKPTISESDAKALELFANKSHRHGVACAVKEYLDGHEII